MHSDSVFVQVKVGCCWCTCRWGVQLLCIFRCIADLFWFWGPRGSVSSVSVLSVSEWTSPLKLALIMDIMCRVRWEDTHLYLLLQRAWIVRIKCNMAVKWWEKEKCRAMLIYWGHREIERQRYTKLFLFECTIVFIESFVVQKVKRRSLKRLNCLVIT